MVPGFLASTVQDASSSISSRPGLHCRRLSPLATVAKDVTPRHGGVQWLEEMHAEKRKEKEKKGRKLNETLGFVRRLIDGDQG